MLFIFNSLKNRKESFKTIDPDLVKMYVCGMTVYDYCHIGHARVLVVFDIVRRWLISLGYNVKYVRNITDIDDKIIDKAQKENKSLQELTNFYINAMHSDALSLGVEKPDFEPRATDYIDEMIGMIKSLLEKKYAYVGKNNDIFFSVRKFKNYGLLSGKSLSDLNAGERVLVDEFKSYPFDFVLWKSAKPNEPSWDSPWGNGRPGWHIECSAMSCNLLGKSFDIHGGGQDLIFPHHENEIAQSEASNNSKFVNYWMHNGFVKVNDDKMSKSTGNFLFVKDILEKYEGEILRFFILRTHYRKPINFSIRKLDNAKSALKTLKKAINCEYEVSEIDWDVNHARKFKSAMNDDFNLPKAISVLFEIANEISANNSNQLRSLLFQLGKIIGLFPNKNQSYGDLKAEIDISLRDEIERHVLLRNEARTKRDFDKADEIRENLKAKGIILEDTSSGTVWKKIE